MRHALDQRVTASMYCLESGTNWRGAGPEGSSNNGTAGSVKRSQCDRATRGRRKPASGHRRRLGRRRDDRHAQLAALGVTVIAGIHPDHSGSCGPAVEHQRVEQLVAAAPRAEQHECDEGANPVGRSGDHVRPILSTGRPPSIPRRNCHNPHCYRRRSDARPWAGELLFFNWVSRRRIQPCGRGVRIRHAATPT